MKHQKLIRVLAAALAVVLTLGVSVFAASYDSSEDPLISLSYLKNIFKPEIEKAYTGAVSAVQSAVTSLENKVDYSIASLENKIEGLENKLATGDYTPPVSETTPPVTETTPPVAETQPAPSASFEVIELTWGDAVYATAACEIMLRAGEAYCIAPDASQGLASITTGAEIYNGQALEKNHLLLIPRGDGRGVMANSQSVFLMVRGEYTIVKGQGN